MKAFEKNIRKVEPYVPGEQPQRKVIKLNTNENPYPPAPGVTKALEEMDTDRFRLYPDPTAAPLVNALADFYHVSADYLLCRTELRQHENKSVYDLHLNDAAVKMLAEEIFNPRLFSELITHEKFKRFMTDLEIYVDGFNDKGLQIANAFLDVMRCKLEELGADSSDAFVQIFDTSHIETEQYYINILSEDLKPIVSDLRTAHMKDSDTASDVNYQSMVKSIIDDFTSQMRIATDDNTESTNDSYINGLILLFCKNLEMKVTQLSVQEKETLRNIFSRSKPAKEHRKLRRRNPKL